MKEISRVVSYHLKRDHRSLPRDRRYIQLPANYEFQIECVNNRNTMAYKYVTSDIDAIHSMELFVQGHLRHRPQAEGTLKWLSSYMKAPFDPYCHNANEKCTMPTYRRRPDVFVQVTSVHHNWPVPLLVVEIIRTKDLWGHAVEEFPGYVESLYTLSMVPIAYYLQVGYAEAKLYRLKRIPEQNRIDIQYTILP